MSQTRRERKQNQKKQQRAKEIRRKANIERNVPAERFRLDVLRDEKWVEGVKYWTYKKDVEYHKTYTEKMREQGSEVLEGRVIDTVKRLVIAHIPASKAKGAAPDKIADGAKAKEI
jgi:hypothetical protein